MLIRKVRSQSDAETPKLDVLSWSIDENLLLAFGDSYTAGGGKQSYPYVAAELLRFQAENFAIGGSTTAIIPLQLIEAGKKLLSATHLVLTIGGNDLAGIQSLVNVANVNITQYEEQCSSFQSTLVQTYQTIKSVVRPTTKIYALPYVDIISVGHKIPYEDECHQIYKALNSVVQSSAAAANISFVEPVISAFAGHEIYSADPYADGFDHPENLYHPNTKGYIKIGQVLAEFIKSH